VQMRWTEGNYNDWSCVVESVGQLEDWDWLSRSQLNCIQWSWTAAMCGEWDSHAQTNFGE